VSEPFETIALPPASRARDAWRLAGGLWLLARAATAPDRTAETLLGQLCTLAVEVVPADGAGVTVVDEVLGRAAGDAVLVEVADRLAHALRSDDTLGHLGGGEFLVVCEDLTGSPARLDRQLRALGDRICRRLRESADGGGRQAMVSVSIGASVGADPDEAQELIDAATRALVAATRAGAGRLVVSGADVPDVVTLADYRSARRTPAGR